jgi:hypothetical protein
MEMEHRLHMRLPKGAHAALSVSTCGKNMELNMTSVFT